MSVAQSTKFSTLQHGLQESVKFTSQSPFFCIHVYTSHYLRETIFLSRHSIYSKYYQLKLIMHEYHDSAAPSSFCIPSWRVCELTA